MNKLYLLLNFISLVLLQSCANHRIKHSGESVPLTVDSSVNNYLEIENSSYGPEPIKNSYEKQKMRSPIWGVYLVPAGSLSFSYLECLEKLEHKGIKLKVIAGSDMSALIAAMYAKYKNKNIIQWKIFKLQIKLKKLKLWYGKEWLETITSFIRDEFKDDRIEKMSILPLIPLIENGNVIVKGAGLISDILEDNFRLNGKVTSYLVGNEHSPTRIFSKVGVDLYATLSVLPDKIDFKSPDDFIWGVYSKLPYMLSSEEYYFKINGLEHSLDEIVEYNTYKKEIENDLTRTVDLLEEMQKDWFENQSH